MTSEGRPRTVRTWHRGEPVEMDVRAWSETVPTFLGSGFRVRFPGAPGTGDPVEFSRRLARRVADLLGTDLDEAPWEHLAAEPTPGSPTEVVGGWAYGLDRTLGPPWTRVVRGGPVGTPPRSATARSLPWLYGSDSPTAGLPMISRLEHDRAEALLAGADEAVGLWWNHRDELCTTTAGPPLLQLSGPTWVFPDDSSGLVPSWAFHARAERLGASPARVTREHLEGSAQVCAISDVGDVTVIERADGRDLSRRRPAPRRTPPG